MSEEDETKFQGSEKFATTVRFMKIRKLSSSKIKGYGVRAVYPLTLGLYNISKKNSSCLDTVTWQMGEMA